MYFSESADTKSTNSSASDANRILHTVNRSMDNRKANGEHAQRSELFPIGELCLYLRRLQHSGQNGPETNEPIRRHERCVANSRSNVEWHDWSWMLYGRFAVVRFGERTIISSCL